MWQKVTHDKRIVGLLTLLVILAAVPLTVSLNQQNQDNRQRAAEAPPVCSETGTDTMLIIDKSNSMNIASSATDSMTRFQRAKNAAKNFADILAQKNANLPEEKKHKLGVISFSNSSLTQQNASLTTDMNLVKQRIDEIQPGDDLTGWTCIECGVKKANAEFTSTRQRTSLGNVAILLTDGKANWVDGGTSSVAQVTAEAKAMEAVNSGYNASSISYFTIGLGAQNEINETFLKAIASTTKAKYYYAPTATDLQGIYTQISQVLGKGSISGSVFHDANANQAYESTEQKLSGWKVTLTQNSQTISSATTDASGNYSFTNVCDGSYQVRLTLQPGWNQTTPPNANPLAVSLSGANNLINQNIGVKQEPLNSTLTCSPSTITLRDEAQAVTATLKDINGNPISGKSISWSSSGGPINLTQSTGTTNTQGMSTINTTADPDTEAAFNGKITARFAGDLNNAPSTCEVTVNFTPKSTSIFFNLYLHGIGSAGDNANTTDVSLSNKNPLHMSRDVTVKIYDDNNTLVKTLTQNSSFSASGGNFPVTAQLGATFPTGKYSVLVSSPGYLTRKVPRIVSLTTASNNNIGRVDLITGDVDTNNTLNILDYDLLTGCYSDYAPPASCTTEQKSATDNNDDGKVDQVDYNLFLRELSVQHGDTIIDEETQI